ncbi:outer membrane lipoprotein carrier protein LolA [Oecophyllibacter saccharovorans]|uniref:Outer membrane lipoprotein carrier protein LolA n=1 Tax=Oecophyllibacter saccharovorans TaxID=2558360 RepID=A0A506UQW8_9PROT|nr:outer membrane lipoprotein carrier protein LolA [Oecophyllibacter saccharovorans]TPW35745.1 outer membrane lipoprotein carrier protein LolA [Oecophyllibacter saccharovorans]
MISVVSSCLPVAGGISALFRRSGYRLVQGLALGSACLLSGCAVSGYSHLPPVQQTEARQVEAWLEGVKSIEAGFVQTGGPAALQGDGVFLYRPGALRMNYAPPHERILVARDGKLVLKDNQSGAVTQLALSRTPLGMLLRTPLRFDDGIQVTDVQRGPSSLQVSLAQASNPSQGLLTLQFSDEQGRLELRGVQGVDGRGHRFGVALYDVRTGVALPPQTFTFP